MREQWVKIFNRNIYKFKNKANKRTIKINKIKYKNFYKFCKISKI